MIQWKPSKFSNYEHLSVTGYQCNRPIAAVYVDQPLTPFWACLHLQSYRLIGFRYETEAQCKKAAEFFIFSNIDWNARTLGELLENNNLTIEKMEELELASAEAGHEGEIDAFMSASGT